MNSDLESLLFLELTAWQPAREGCPSAEDLAAWLDGAAPDAALETHLERCASCRADALVVKAIDLSPPCASLPRERPRSNRGLSRRRNKLSSQGHLTRLPSEGPRTTSKRTRAASKRTRAASKRTGVPSRRSRVGSARPSPATWGLQLLAAAAVLLLLVGVLRQDRPAPPTAQARAVVSPVVAATPTLVSAVVADAARGPASDADAAPRRRAEPTPTGLDLLGQLLEESLQDDDDDDAPAPTEVAPAPAEVTVAPVAAAPAAPAPSPETKTPAAPPRAGTTELAAAPGRDVTAEGLRVRRAGRVGWTDLERDPVLRAGDRLRGSPAGGVLALASLEVYVAPRARLEVDGSLNLALVRGQLLMLGSGHVETPAGEVTVDGEALLAVSHDRLGLRVIAGKAACSHPSGLLLLAAGEDLLASAQRASVPQPAPHVGHLPGWTRALPRAPEHVDLPAAPPSATGLPATQPGPISSGGAPTSTPSGDPHASRGGDRGDRGGRGAGDGASHGANRGGGGRGDGHGARGSPSGGASSAGARGGRGGGGRGGHGGRR